MIIGLIIPDKAKNNYEENTSFYFHFNCDV